MPHTKGLWILLETLPWKQRTQHQELFTEMLQMHPVFNMPKSLALVQTLAFLSSMKAATPCLLHLCYELSCLKE